jgi:hypothetical protein
MFCRTFAITSSHQFALSSHFSLQQSRNLRLEFRLSNESLNYKLPLFGEFESKVKSWYSRRHTRSKSAVCVAFDLACVIQIKCKSKEGLNNRPEIVVPAHKRRQALPAHGQGGRGPRARERCRRRGWRWVERRQGTDRGGPREGVPVPVRAPGRGRGLRCGEHRLLLLREWLLRYPGGGVHRWAGKRRQGALHARRVRGEDVDLGL